MPNFNNLPTIPTSFYSPPLAKGKELVTIRISIEAYDDSNDLEKVLNSIWFDNWKENDGREFKVLTVKKTLTEAKLVVLLKS
jgi:hypothetical protein